MSGANLSEGPAGTGYSGDASGLKVPFDGVYMMMGQVRIEGPSTSERIEVQIRQGALGSEVTVSTEQIRRDAGAGSIGFTIVGRASVMAANEYVRLYIRPITAGSIQLSEARVQAFYLGNNAKPAAGQP
jgi:hypothetical protein